MSKAKMFLEHILILDITAGEIYIIKKNQKCERSGCMTDNKYLKSSYGLFYKTYFE